MTALREKLLPPQDALIQDLALALENQLSRVGGLKGISLRAAIGMMKAGRDDAIPDAMRRLLPGMLEALEPFHQAYLEAAPGGYSGFEAYAKTRQAEVSSALEGVIDARVANSSNAKLRSGYARLRGPLAALMGGASLEFAAVVGRHYAQSTGTPPG